MNIVPSYVDIEFLRRALAEDIGRGDITTIATVPATARGKGLIRAKEPMVLCGVNLVGAVYHLLDPTLTVLASHADGDSLKSGDLIATVSGCARSILTGERTVLNFLQRLSGIATGARSCLAMIDRRSKTRIVDTRKTTPGWRTLEKYAVSVGGCRNHRFGLDDGILIKDNHIAAAGSITTAVKKARAAAHHLLKIEVEVTSLDEVREALNARADIIMLDNMDIPTIKKAIALIKGRALIEVSGGMTPVCLAEVSRLGADFISVGALTHSARAVDINLTFVLD